MVHTGGLVEAGGYWCRQHMQMLPPGYAISKRTAEKSSTRANERLFALGFSDSRPRNGAMEIGLIANDRWMCVYRFSVRMLISIGTRAMFAQTLCAIACVCFSDHHTVWRCTQEDCNFGCAHMWKYADAHCRCVCVWVYGCGELSIEDRTLRAPHRTLRKLMHTRFGW